MLRKFLLISLVVVDFWCFLSVLLGFFFVYAIVVRYISSCFSILNILELVRRWIKAFTLQHTVRRLQYRRNFSSNRSYVAHLYTAVVIPDRKDSA